MRLIYFYLANCFDVDFNLEINFSEDKEINLTNTRELKIIDLEYTPLQNFYGNNIINVNAVVGQNGVGKSTIFNILGLSHIDLHSCYPNSQWVAIYEHNDIYFLEGFNADKIINIRKVNQSYIAYRLRRTENILHLDSFIQYENDIQNKYCVIHKPNFSNSINGKGRRNIHDNDDRNYGFKRNYLQTNMANFYEFITKNANDFCSHINKKSIDIKIEAYQTHEEKKEFKFYNDFDRYLDSNIILFNQNKPKKIQDSKKLFVINFMEEYILHIIHNSFDEKNRIICQELINSNRYNSDILDYDKIKAFLLKTIKNTIELLTENDDEIVSYLDDIEWTVVINFLENNDKLFFIKEGNGLKENVTCSINLNNYDDKVHSFISKVGAGNNPIILKMPKMSTGEFDINSKIAGINKAIKLTLENNPEIHGFIIILDEYDEHLHPEWSRLFLDYLLQYLSRGYNNYFFQILLSTHSPYVISDLLKENVIKIEYIPSEGKYYSSKANRSFASNIYDIINDSFFLSQPIGEFAVRKLNELLTQIDNLNMNTTSKNYTNLRNIIHSIDDEYIRQTLINQLNANYNHDKKIQLDKLDDEINTLIKKKEKILSKMDEKKHD
ncbi:TPA: AAA family ATPase [Klebsiella pneumoniae]|uniref:AAA family ATPase n=5 Tax=Klebsiella pneumoniae TaxID=573 RepID=UPI0022A6670A|nr:AAA family ATPase [Klebsiella pneumoniae]MCZ0818152.1 AAA family ATPase [Klebsiella pneumoniae]HCC4332790.1 AAA family ATPase [Klebsiella pneumoniae]